jgi:hypothetical protein
MRPCVVVNRACSDNPGWIVVTQRDVHLVPQVTRDAVLLLDSPNGSPAGVDA